MLGTPVSAFELREADHVLSSAPTTEDVQNEMEDWMMLNARPANMYRRMKERSDSTVSTANGRSLGFA